MPYFVRVKDPSTGHQFDVPEKDPRIGKVFTLLNSDRYPRARVSRPPKYHISPVAAPVVAEESSDTSPASESSVEATAETTDTPESKSARVKSRK